MRAPTTLLVTAAVVAGGAAGVDVAAATPGPTPPEGLTGACNMTNSHAAFGMFDVAGNHANPHGWEDGMVRAIMNTNGGDVPANCQGPPEEGG